MNHPLRILCFAGVSAFCTIAFSDASVVFKPKNGKVVTPGEEQSSANAQQLFSAAQAAEQRHDYGRAIKDYTRLVRTHPKDALAPGAAYRKAQLQEQIGDYLKAAETYRFVVEKYPQFERFNDAIEAQFRIGEMYLNGKKTSLLGLHILSALDKARTIFAGIVKSAPYGKYTARAQFNIGRAAEKEGNDEGAVAAYQQVIDKFPNEPVAADAQYQIGYIWYKSTQQGTRDASATKNAKTGFQDFLYRHPNSEKAAQAREDLKRLESKETTDYFKVAKFYDKQKNYRAAAIYYNEVIGQQPNSPQGEQAKKRVAELRAKVGDAALQPAIKPGPAKKPTRETASSRESNPSMRETAPDVAPLPPLPPADADVSLPPPPGMLMPDTASSPSGSSGSSPKAEPTASPEPSASPF